MSDSVNKNGIGRVMISLDVNNPDGTARTIQREVPIQDNIRFNLGSQDKIMSETWTMLCEQIEGILDVQADLYSGKFEEAAWKHN